MVPSLGALKKCVTAAKLKLGPQNYQLCPNYEPFVSWLNRGYKTLGTLFFQVSQISLLVFLSGMEDSPILNLQHDNCPVKYKKVNLFKCGFASGIL